MALYLGLTIMRKCWTLQGLTEILPYVFHRQDGLCFHESFDKLYFISGDCDTLKKEKYKIFEIVRFLTFKIRITIFNCQLLNTLSLESYLRLGT